MIRALVQLERGRNARQRAKRADYVYFHSSLLLIERWFPAVTLIEGGTPALPVNLRDISANHVDICYYQEI
jgi:hypothetical protein